MEEEILTIEQEVKDKKVTGNKRNQPLIIICLTIVLLLLLSLIPRDAKIGGISLKPVDLFSDIKAE